MCILYCWLIMRVDIYIYIYIQIIWNVVSLDVHHTLSSKARRFCINVFFFCSVHDSLITLSRNNKINVCGCPFFRSLVCHPCWLLYQIYVEERRDLTS